jgi:hypothetical protein
MIVSTGLLAGICGPLFMWLMTPAIMVFCAKTRRRGNWRLAG